MLFKVWLYWTILFFGYNNILRLVLRRIYVNRKLKEIHNQRIRSRINTVYRQINQNLDLKEEKQIISLVQEYQNLNTNEIYQIYLQMILTDLPFTKINNRVYLVVLLVVMIVLYFI